MKLEREYVLVRNRNDFVQYNASWLYGVPETGSLVVYEGGIWRYDGEDADEEGVVSVLSRIVKTETSEFLG